MATDSDIRAAYAVASTRLGTIAARQIACAIGLLESGYGLSGGWVLPDGRPSYNWGALIGKGDAGSVVHGDHDKNGKPTSVAFAAFSSMQAGFSAFMGTWARQDTVNAANVGDAYGVAAAMYDHHYYTGTKGSPEERITLYADAIHGAAARVSSATVTPLSVKTSAQTTYPRRGSSGLFAGRTVGQFVVGAGAVALGWWGMKHWRDL